MNRLTDDLTRALEVIHTNLKDSDITWVIVGSIHMALEGMDVSPNDIDIAVHYDNLGRVPGYFPGYRFSEITPLASGKGAAKITSDIEGIEVEFIGEQADGIYTKRMDQQMTSITCRGREYPVLTLEAEAGSYREMGRDRKADLIRHFLKG